MVVDLLQEPAILGGYWLVIGEGGIRANGGGKDESDIAVGYDVRGNIATAGLEASICQRGEAQTGGVVGGRLLGIAHVPSDMIVAVEIGRGGKS